MTLYITLVLQTLWNWFASPVFHSDISYWNMYGLLLIPTSFKAWSSLSPTALLDLKIAAMVEASLPEHKTMLALEVFSKLSNPAAVEGMRAFGATISLVVGFGVHTFLI